MEVAKRNIHILYNRHLRPLIRKMSLTSTIGTAVWPEEDLALPKDSKILITGANGYIASHIVKEALDLGFAVKGTVRDQAKGDKLKAAFNNESLEIVVVEDLAAPGAFDKAVEGCDAVVHAATVTTLSPDPEYIKDVVDGATGILRSAVKAGTVKRFVYTSSSTACTLPILNTKFTIDKSTWNQSSIDKVKEFKPPHDPSQAFDVYGASKTLAEKAIWDFVKDEKPSFVVNSIIPNANLGADPPLQPGSTGTWPDGILLGNFPYFDMVPPQWYVHVADDAKLHLAALIDKTVENDRVFGKSTPSKQGRQVC